MHFKEDKDGYLGTGHNRHLYLLDVQSKTVEPLTTGPELNEDLPAWSPDGRRIAFVRSHEKGGDADGMTDIELLDVPPASAPVSPAAPASQTAAAQPSKLLRVYVPNQQKLAWSSDGTTLAFLQGVEPKYGQYGQDRLAIVKTAGSAPQVLTDSLDRGVSSYVLDKDAATITVTIDDDTTAYPVLIKTHATRKLTQGLSIVSDLNSAGGHTAVLSSNDTSPTEVYALEGEHLRKLTKHNDAFIAQLQLGAVQDILFKSADGTPIHGLVVKPPGFEPGRKYPTVLYIHGGPNLQDDHSLAFDGYQFKRQLLAASGFVVLGVNYRGSSGKGDAFSRAILADWGHKEVEDLMAGVDFLVQQGIADPGRLGIGGWSYGGMLTDYTIASNTRFAAALSGAGTANPLGMYAGDQYYIQYNKELGDPWHNPDLYIKLAYPLLHADRIRTPTLFMGGDKDFNVPILGGEQMYLALRTLGVPAQLIVYPGQYHTLTRPSFLKDRLERMTAWYMQYLISSAR
jgi:dipeptidyl aminopeptidase/acylaminoacyl peptidase